MSEQTGGAKIDEIHTLARNGLTHLMGDELLPTAQVAKNLVSGIKGNPDSRVNALATQLNKDADKLIEILGGPATSSSSSSSSSSGLFGSFFRSTTATAAPSPPSKTTTPASGSPAPPPSKTTTPASGPPAPLPPSISTTPASGSPAPPPSKTTTPASGSPAPLPPSKTTTPASGSPLSISTTSASGPPTASSSATASSTTPLPTSKTTTPSGPPAPPPSGKKEYENTRNWLQGIDKDERFRLKLKTAMNTVLTEPTDTNPKLENARNLLSNKRKEIERLKGTIESKDRDAKEDFIKKVQEYVDSFAAYNKTRSSLNRGSWFTRKNSSTAVPKETPKGFFNGLFKRNTSKLTKRRDPALNTPKPGAPQRLEIEMKPVKPNRSVSSVIGVSPLEKVPGSRSLLPRPAPSPLAPTTPSALEKGKAARRLLGGPSKNRAEQLNPVAPPPSIDPDVKKGLNTLNKTRKRRLLPPQNTPPLPTPKGVLPNANNRVGFSPLRPRKPSTPAHSVYSIEDLNNLGSVKFPTSIVTPSGTITGDTAVKNYIINYLNTSINVRVLPTEIVSPTGVRTTDQDGVESYLNAIERLIEKNKLEALKASVVAQSGPAKGRNGTSANGPSSGTSSAASSNQTGRNAIPSGNSSSSSSSFNKSGPTQGIQRRISSSNRSSSSSSVGPLYNQGSLSQTGGPSPYVAPSNPLNTKLNPTNKGFVRGRKQEIESTLLQTPIIQVRQTPNPPASAIVGLQTLNNKKGGARTTRKYSKKQANRQTRRG